MCGKGTVPNIEAIALLSQEGDFPLVEAEGREVAVVSASARAADETIIEIIDFFMISFLRS
jgi:hypothetical protein